MRRSDLLPSFPPRSVVLRLAVPPRASVFVTPQRPDAGREAWSFRVWQPHATRCGLETAGTPKFLGNPCVPMPCSSTPAGPMHQAIRRTSTAPALEPRRRLPTMKKISGLYHTASALAAYASPTWLPSRTQDSLLAVGQLYEAGLVTRRTPTKGFDDDPYILSSFPRFCLAQGSSSLFLGEAREFFIQTPSPAQQQRRGTRT
jgi:hypothetical protein